MSAALAALLIAAAAPALHVDVSLDARLPCAGHAALASALRELLPGLQVEAEAAASGDDLVATLQRAHGQWLLLLRRPGGEVALQRRLAMGARECALLGQTGALIVDRFLEEIRWAGRPAQVQPLPVRPEAALPSPPLVSAPIAPPPIAAAPAAPLTRPTEPAGGESALSSSGASPDSSAPPVVSDSAAAAGPAARAPQPPPTPVQPAVDPPPLSAALSPPGETIPPQRITEAPPILEAAPAALAPTALPLQPATPLGLAISAGPAAALGLPSDLRFAVSLEATVRRGEHQQLTLSLLGAAPSSSAVVVEGETRGQLSVQAASALFTPALCATGIGVRACLGPLLGLRASLGSASGSRLNGTHSDFLVQPQAGGGVFLAVPLGTRFELGLSFLAAASLGSGSFAIAGAPSRALPALDLLGSLRLGWLAF